MNERQRSIMQRLADGRGVTSRQCQAEFGVTRPVTVADFTRLLELGLAEQLGPVAPSVIGSGTRANRQAIVKSRPGIVPPPGDAFLLAIDRVDGDQASAPPDLRRPVGREPDFGVTGGSYSAADLCEPGGSAQKEVRASGPIRSL